jgi:hypothetical protein
MKATTGTLPKPEMPDNLVLWLSQLTLLYGMPIENLVPDVRMLPVESMRFFFLDRNWLDRLVDGALSVGVLSTREAVFNEAFFEDIYAQVDERQLQLRATLRGKATLDATDTGSMISGVLFRSQVVSGWPGLEINGYAQGKLLNILRMDQLSDSTLICLWDGVPDQVDFIEPAEGLCFGINMKTGSTTAFDISLRGLGFPNVETYPPGEQIIVNQVPLTATGTLLNGNNQPPGVVDIAGLVANIQQNMPAGALENGVLTSGGFAIQMTKGAGLQSYQFGYTPCSAS